MEKKKQKRLKIPSVGNGAGFTTYGHFQKLTETDMKKTHTNNSKGKASVET